MERTRSVQHTRGLDRPSSPSYRPCWRWAGTGRTAAPRFGTGIAAGGTRLPQGAPAPRTARAVLAACFSTPHRSRPSKCPRHHLMPAFLGRWSRAPQNAAAVILTHNHLSGVAEPSQADRQLTQRLKDALALIDVRCFHFIVGDGAAGWPSLPAAVPAADRAPAKRSGRSSRRRCATETAWRASISADGP